MAGMIPYEELDRALARWKARAQGAGAAPVDAGHEVAVESGAVVVSDFAAAVEAEASGPLPAAQTGELDLETESLDTFDDEEP
jgi:hypothetical protein